MAAGIGRSLAIVLIAAIAGGCSSSPPPPMTIDGRIVVGSHLNPDANDRPSPLTVRIYQLRSPETLLSSSYEALERGDSAVLATDLLKREVYEFCPPEVATGACRSGDVELKVKLESDARYIGVFAQFYDTRSPESRWREAREIPPARERMLRSDVPPVLRIELGERAVSLTFE